MSKDLTEAEMRQALFGSASLPTIAASAPTVAEKATRVRGQGFSSKLLVTLHVSNEFEGDYEVVQHETPTLSRLVAEMDAKKKFSKKFKYVTVVSVVQV